MNIVSSIKQLRLLLIMALVAGLALVGQAAPAYAAGKTFTVNNSLVDAPDAAPGDGKCETASGNNICTLRAAIMETNALAGADTINLQAGTTYVLTRAGIDDTALNGDLNITGDLTINGAGATIDGGNVDRVFHIQYASPRLTANIANLTIQHGNPAQYHLGGGIYNDGVLTLTNVTVRDNVGWNHGGGILNDETLTLINSTVSGNQGGLGAGIANEHATLTLINSTIRDNTSVASNGDGGGIFIFSQNNSSTVKVINSTISGNKANYDGGGIYNEGGALTLVNSTVSNNTAAHDGGGIYNSYNNYNIGTVNLHNATILYNWADSNKDGVGLGGGINNNGGVVNFLNTLISNNLHLTSNFFTPDDCKGTLNSEDYNLMLDTTGCTIGGATTHNKIGASAQPLSNLQNNGGPTATYALLAGSPAIDAGNPGGCADTLGASLTTDQRGYARPAGSACDIGAYEYGSAAAKQGQTISFAVLVDRLLKDSPFQISATASSGLLVTFTASGQCSVNGNTVTLSGQEGNCTITAHQSGNANYNAASDVARSFTIYKLSQTITFASLPNKTVGDPPFTVSATASSGLPVTFTASGKCGVNGNMVTLSGQAGSCTITAHQAGNATYNAAPDVARSFTINKQDQTISFAPLPDKAVGDSPFQISATASSGLSVTFTASGKCSVNGNLVTLSGKVGACTITAHQAGNATYKAAPDVARSFVIADPAKQGQTISFAPLPNKTLGDPPIAISATASSGLPVAYRASGQCGVSGNIVTLIGAGSCTITAQQPGNTTYNAAADVPQTFQISASGPANSTVYLPLLVR